jgi:N-acetylglucosaminyldiphosphoundecaprenol N-acetyl-beta-D-mannosaminyltransferase
MEGCSVNLAGTYRNDRTDILGVGVSSVSLDDAVERIERWIGERSRNYVCVTGVHGIMESRRDQRLRSIHNDAGMVTPDGMPLVWFSRLMGRLHTQRVYGPDLMRKLTAVSKLRGYRQFYYGGAVGVSLKLTEILLREHTQLKVVGALCPPFRELTSEEDAVIVATINAARPDIVWVGLSTPKQELWMARHLGLIDAPVMIGVGAAFDFLAGTKRQAPRWMQRSGLEWLFRLCTEPRRLWRRYAFIVPGFLILATGELMRRFLGFSNLAPAGTRHEEDRR